MARITLDANKKSRLVAAIEGRGEARAFVAQRDGVIGFVLPVVLFALGGAGINFGRGGSNAAALIFYPGLAIVALGVVLLGLVAMRTALGPPLGRYLFASGIVDVGLLGVYFHDVRELSRIQFQRRYGRGTRVYLNTMVIGLRGSAIACELVVDAPEHEVQAQEGFYLLAAAELTAARARGDAAAVRALDPLA